MRAALLLFLSSVVFIRATAQKPALDTGVLYHWPSVEGGSLSPNGQYAGYLIRSGLGGTTSLVLKAITSGWERRFPRVQSVSFSLDSRQALFLTRGDTLVLVSLGGSSEERIPQVGTFQLFDQGGEEFLLYSRKDSTPRLVICSLHTGRERILTGVTSWLLAQNGRILLTKQPDNANKDSEKIARIDLVTGHEQMIWEGRAAGSWVMDSAGSRVAFTGRDTDGYNHVWYYKKGQEKARPAVGEQANSIDSGWGIGRLLSFCCSGSRLLLTLHQKELPIADPSAVSVDIWSYSDAKLQSQQLDEMGSPQEFLAVLRLDSGFALQWLQRDGEKHMASLHLDDYVVFDSTQGDPSEQPWSTAAQPHYEVVALRSGERRTLHRQVLDASPAGRFLVLLTADTRDMSTYELATGKIREITAGLSLPDIRRYRDDVNGLKMHFILLSGWLPHDSKMIAYDLNDIWELDPLATAAPLNLTHHYGRDHHILFRPALRPAGRLIGDQSLLLSAFDEQTKDNGFCQIALHREQDPMLPAQGPWLYYAPFSLPGEPVVKAAQAPVYLVQRQEATQSPNYFTTHDFKAFTPVSEVYPERNYRWMTSRLLHFATEDGRQEKGILYLPGDFDSTRTYPLILHYYERRSDELHLYRSPSGHAGDLNIPWFVSQGYCVFVPDIHFSLGRPGESVLQTVEGAALFLKTLAGVKLGKIGLQGHSYGGWETNYLITHSHNFAAAISSAGPSNIISEYGDIMNNSVSNIGFIENSQLRMGATLWEHPEYYIRSSPLFAADHVTTPVLLISNHRDPAVSFSQGLAFFTALRRLGKSAWMLQYDSGGHGQYGPDRTDGLLRMTQFFDYYLKGSPAPRWMTRGIPARQKGVDRGFTMDPPGNPSAGSLLVPSSGK